MASKRALPPRLTQKGNTYYWIPYVNGKQKWTRLSNNLPEALELYKSHELGAQYTGSIGEVLSNFREDHLPGLAAKTQTEYRRSIEYLTAALGHIPALDLKSSHVYAYIDAEANKHRKTAVNRDVRCLSSALARAKRRNLIENNVCLGIEMNKEAKRNRYLTDKEFRTIRKFLPPMLALAMDIAYLTSIRKGDMLRLKRSDLFKKGDTPLLMINQQKTKDAYSISLDKQLEDTLNRLESNSDYFIHKRDGGPYQETGFDSIWQRRIRKIEKEHNIPSCCWHDIRAKSATDVAERTDIHHAHKLLGHRSIATTERYIRQRSREAVPSTGKVL